MLVTYFSAQVQFLGSVGSVGSDYWVFGSASSEQPLNNPNWTFYPLRRVLLETRQDQWALSHQGPLRLQHDS